MDTERVSLRKIVNSYNALFIERPELWLPKYGVFDREIQMRRLEHVIQSLPAEILNTPETREDIESSFDFINHSFDLYEGKVDTDIEGSFGFVVPTRIRRLESGMTDEYSSEIDTLIPILKHTDASVRQVLMAGMCPFIIDRYHTDEDGRAGAMIYAPILGDLPKDIGDFSKTVATIHKIINDTSDFAKERLGVEIIGLGAILPRITGFGGMIERSDLTVTTGHAATVWLIKQAIERAFESGYARPTQKNKIGIIGTGAIGASVAALLLESGLTSTISLSDVNEMRGEQVITELLAQYPSADLNFSLSNSEAVNDSSVVVCAAATKFDLNLPEWDGADFEGAWIVDDSQPGAFLPEQVRARKGEVEWPIAIDRSSSGAGTLKSFEYGNHSHSGPTSKKELFGCEAEAVSLYLTKEYGKAVREAVQPYHAIAIGGLLSQTGIELAKPQSLGAYLNI